jgi:hypothetical protein
LVLKNEMVKLLDDKIVRSERKEHIIFFFAITVSDIYVSSSSSP